jgi:intracellular multiplication protein IcmP
MTAQKPNEPDAMWTMIWLLVVVGLAAGVFWYVFRVPILEGLRWLRLGELWVVGLFSHQQDRCFSWLLRSHTGPPDVSSTMAKLAYDCFGTEFMGSLPSEKRLEYFSLTGASMAAVERIATIYIRWPLAVVFAIVAVYIMFFSPRNKFKTRHTIESFIKTQAKMWPVISPIVDFNPIKSSARIPGSEVPDKLPLFAEALSPEEWISWHRIPVSNGVVDREAARRALLLQLGPRWNGLDGQAPYFRALFAAFALKGAQKREESDEFLGDVSLCWTAKAGFHLTPKVAAEVKKIIHDPEIGGKALEEAARHAYRTTAMLGVLRWARSMGGVLAPAQFLWLRGTDRHLWYALNNLGRRSFHAEGMGAMAHFMAEQAAKKPLPIPRVDTAVVTLNQFLSDPEKRSIPIPPREGDNAEKGR